MGKFLVGIIAAVGAFLAVGVFSGGADGIGESGASRGSVQWEGCMRAMRKQAASEADAEATCECLYTEFEKRDIGLLDAFGSDFDDMSAITQSCAADNGIYVQG